MDGAVAGDSEREVASAVDRVALRLVRHWLLILNVAVGIFATLPFLSPYLKSVGWVRLGDLLFKVYQPFCHQMPERSFFIFGYQVSYCQRDVAIYTSIFLGGLLFARLRPRLPGLSPRWYAVLILPMALDGFTQLFGLRESTWELRVITGTLFGLATVWLLYPVLNRAFAESRRTLEERFACLGSPA